jgi:hypothetical protein
LQWRPELGQAVPLNVFDELGAHGTDTWLEQVRQVPRAEDASADQGLTWDEIVRRQLRHCPREADTRNSVIDSAGSTTPSG